MIPITIPSPEDFTLEPDSPASLVPAIGASPSRPLLRTTGAFMVEMVERFRQRPASTLDLMAPFGGIAARDEDGRTLLHWALKHAPDDSKLVRALIEHGADLEALDQRDDTPLSLAFKASENRLPVDTVTTLLRAGALPYFSRPATWSRHGRSPVHEVVLGHPRENWLDVLNTLLERGALVTTRDDEGNTPLHDAVRYQRLEIVRRLLAAGASVEARNHQGRSPLMIALWVNRSPEDRTPISDHDRTVRQRLVTLLLEAGADPGQTFADPARGQMSVLELVASERPPSVPLFLTLVAAGADPFHPTQDGAPGPLATIQTAIDEQPQAEQPALRVPLEAMVLRHALAETPFADQEPLAVAGRAPVRPRL